MNIRFWLSVGVAAIAVACVHHDPTEQPARARVVAVDQSTECSEQGVHTRPDTCDIKTVAEARDTDR